jgi:hypothetical protein
LITTAAAAVTIALEGCSMELSEWEVEWEPSVYIAGRYVGVVVT